MQLWYLELDVPSFVVMVGESEGQWVIDEAKIITTNDNRRSVLRYKTKTKLTAERSDEK